MAADARAPLAVYGTLLDADVRRLVLGRCTGRPAVLRGWERVYVAGEVYPGIRQREGASLDVMVLQGLGRHALTRADTFEGPEYTRKLLPVIFEDDGAAGEAMVYVPTAAVRLTDRAWYNDWAWRCRHRWGFLAMTRAAMAGRGLRRGATQA